MAVDKCVPNEIIVKFREPVASILEEQLEVNRPPAQLTLSKGLDQLSREYRVRQVKPLCKNFRKNLRLLKALQAGSKSPRSERQERILRRLRRGPKNAKVPDIGRLYKIQLDLELGQLLQEVIEAYQSSPDVEYAELNYIVSISREPNDPYYPIQWPLHNTGQMYPESGKYNHPPGTPDSDIDAPAAWDIITDTSDTIVAVLDTGVDYNHRDLAGNMWTDANGCYGYDFINDDNDPMDDHGHGTHCSGIIAAEGDNGLDVVGVCWDARIMALKFLGTDGIGDSADAVSAVYYAVENGADIISNSWGGFIGSGYPKSLKQAFDYAYSQGVISVAAAGNLDWELIDYPAFFDSVISVAATDSDDEKAPFSNYGEGVDIAAPGVDVLSLRATTTGKLIGKAHDAYTTIASGTSMACPYVSGAFALLLSLYPDIDIEEAKDIILETTDWISPEICISGRLNLYKAIRVVADLYAGAVHLDSDVYSCSDVVQIFLSDLNLAGNDTQDVNVSTTGGDLETVILEDTVPPSGVFYGTISTDSNDIVIENGVLQLSHGETITVTYEDEDDGTGNPATVTETAVADCQAPVVFDIWVDVPGPEPTVTFETNEPTLASVLCGLTCGGPNIIEHSDYRLATAHSVKLTGVSPNTEYFFIVQAFDIAQNETIEDNNGQCDAFTTNGPCDIYVPSQYPTIQQAIEKAWDGSVIWLAEGRYAGDGNRNIDFLGRAITIQSIDPNDPCVVAATIIDCNGTKAEHHRGFYFQNGEGPNSIVAGLTITGGYRNGGAIFCFCSSPTIASCIISGNKATFSGGAIEFLRSSPIITNCTINANTARIGGAIYSCDSSPAITNCIVSANKAVLGGGIWCEGGTPTIINSTICGNLADGGGGISCWGTTETISNCIIWNNVASVVPQLFPLATPTYCCIQDWTGGGQGNIDTDPCFAGMGCWDPNGTPGDTNDDFWVEGDYHLKSEGWRWDPDANQWTWDYVTSRCIDAGNPASALRGEALTLDVDPLNRCGQNLRINMGAYGGTEQASMPPYNWTVLADLTNDGSVDFVDLAHWTQDWLSNGTDCPGDLYRNGIVDMFDFALLTQDWSLQTTWH